MFKPCFCSFLLLVSVVAAAPDREVVTAAADGSSIPVSDDYVLRTWEVDDGLPNNSIWSIAQTPDGYLWLATGSGLASFDGTRFTSFPKNASPGLASNRMVSVFVARDGALWIGLERGGVARRIGGRFEAIAPMAPSVATVTWTNSFAQDPDGAIWFGYYPDQTVFRWLDGNLSTFTSAEGVGSKANTSVIADVNGKVWFTSVSECGVFDGKRFQEVDPGGGERPMLAPAREGGMWAFRGTRLLRYQADGTRKVMAESGNLSANAIFEDSSGDVWIGTKNQGLFRFRDGTFVRVPTSHSGISSIMEDREGNLWVGTFGGGLNRLRPCRFFLRQKAHGLRTDSIVSLCEDAEGTLWLACKDGLPVRALDSGNRSFATPDGVPVPPIMAMCPDPAGGVWMASLGGLLHWRDGISTHESLKEPLTGVMVDRQGELWVATIKDGLVRWRNGRAERISEADGLLEARALAEDGKGTLWVGTEAGLVFQRQNDQFVPVPLPGEKSNEQVRFIVPDEDDTVWIGVFGGGIYRWRAGQVACVPHDAGLPVEDLRVMAIEPGGDFWFGTGSGIFRVARSEMDATIDGRQKSMRTVAYRRSDGMPNIDFVPGFKNTTTRTRDGHLWFATSSGALEISPQKSPKLAPPFPVLIEEIQIGGAPLALSNGDGLTLPPKPEPLQIRYTLPQLSAPEQIRFRYRLVGLGENEWISAGTQRTATLAHLPPGDFRFEVAAAEADGPWLPGAASLPFTVRAAWWETEWFRVGMWLLVALAIAALVRFIVSRRLNARMRKLEHETALERERTRIARDMHDELGANLTQITVMGELARVDSLEAASGHIDKMVSIARGTVVSLDEIVWAVNPRYDTLFALIEYIGKYAFGFLSSAGIACEIDIPSDPPIRTLGSSVRHDLFMAVKESLNNVVKHAGARSVKLKIEVTEGILRVVVTDDGRGFAIGSEPEDANGLLNLRERMAEAGGVYRIESRIGEGTRVTVELSFT